jgi:RNA polymerase sigma factor (sigma-70 family)
MTRKEYNIAVDLYADGLYRFILKSMNGNEAAKDVVQDVFIKLWEKHENIQFEKIKSYLFTAGYRTMLNVFRDNKRSASFDEVLDSDYSHNNQYSDLNEILDDAVAKLPKDQRVVVLLRDYEGYSYQEIGELLNLSESQVKVYIFRARKFLQQYLKSIETVLEK